MPGIEDLGAIEGEERDTPLRLRENKLLHRHPHASPARIIPDAMYRLSRSSAPCSTATRHALLGWSMGPSVRIPRLETSFWQTDWSACISRTTARLSRRSRSLRSIW